MALSQSFFARSLAAALAAVSVTAMANGAEASNLANFSTSSWTGKSTDLGSFGAGYDASFTTDLTDGALTGEASGSASIQLFGTTVSIAELEATASINDSSAEGGSLTVKAVGATIYDLSFSDGFDYSTQDYCTSFFDVTATMTLVVVPITMFASADGCAGVSASATPQYNTTTQDGTLNLEATPKVWADLVVGAGVGSRTFSAGVEANVALVDITLPITVAPTYNFGTQNFSYTTTGELTLDLLSGSLDLYASVDLGLWDKKYSTTIFDWEGISRTWTLWAKGEPNATNLSASITGQKVVGSYTYTDTANIAQSGSTHLWYRNSVGEDTGRTQISSSTTYADRVLADVDAEKYLQYCVIPRNSDGVTGDEQCSDWTYVGKMAILYPHYSYGTFTGGSHVAVAYEKLASGKCFNLSDMYSDTLASYPFDNAISSYKLYAPTDQPATFKFYQNADCSSTTSTDYVSKVVDTASSSLQTTMGDLGTGWNDALSSFKVVYLDESVTASDLSVTISGNTATADYTFEVSGNALSTTETGSTYVWYRASNSSGSGSTVISGSTTSQHALIYEDDRKYLRVCVTPSNGTSIGDQVCSSWTSVGRLLKFFEDVDQGGSNMAIAWEKSARETCFNMADYGFDNIVSSYNWYNNSVANSTVWLYTDSDCTGSVATRTVAQGSSEAVTNVSTTMGSNWNDSISSFKVSWHSSINITTPTLTISGNTATESHTYSDDTGYSESGTTYTWYRATDSSGSNATELDNFNKNTYELTADDKWAYLRVCVHAANSAMIDEYTECSSWTYVGPVLRLWADSSASGVDLNIAFEKSPSGTCFNLEDYSFDDVVSSAKLYMPSTGWGMAYMYKDANCIGTGSWVPSGSGISCTFTGSSNDAFSSFKVVYEE